MSKWFMRVFLTVVVCYVGFIVITAAVHTVCDCVR